MMGAGVTGAAGTAARGAAAGLPMKSATAMPVKTAAAMAAEAAAMEIPVPVETVTMRAMVTESITAPIAAMEGKTRAVIIVIVKERIVVGVVSAVIAGPIT